MPPICPANGRRIIWDCILNAREDKACQASIESVIQKPRQYIIVFDTALGEEKKRYPVFQLENITAN